MGWINKQLIGGLISTLPPQQVLEKTKLSVEYGNMDNKDEGQYCTKSTTYNRKSSDNVNVSHNPLYLPQFQGLFHLSLAPFVFWHCAHVHFQLTMMVMIQAWRQGFRHPTRHECIGWFAQIHDTYAPQLHWKLCSTAYVYIYDDASFVLSLVSVGPFWSTWNTCSWPWA